MRTLSISLFAAVLATVALGGSCSYRNGELNRVVDPYWKKADFSPEQEWYYHTIIVDVPPETGIWAGLAEGDVEHLEKLKWQITENMLIGWRSYATIPGSDIDTYPGSEDIYKGEPVAMFRITDHFDIKQDFDPGTGEKGNVIGENHDRLWFDRAFFRVDWSTNLVPTYKTNIILTQMFDSNAVQANDPGEPKRWRFENDDKGNLDYFEVTTKAQVAPDIYSYFGYYGVPYMGDDAGAIIAIRNSFMKVDASDYEPQSMPPSVTLEDADGNEVRDARGFAVKVPINDRFGFFGTFGRTTWDENRGLTVSGELNNATRYDIWEHHRNPDGTLIPVDQRVPKQITYYTNVETPTALQEPAKKVGLEWNRAFRDMIAAVQPQKYTGAPDEFGIPSDVPTMFEVKQNDCNFDNVKSVLDTLPKDVVGQITAAAKRDAANADLVDFDGTFADAKKRFDNSQDESQGTFTSRTNEETQALNDLERVCTAMEYYTAGDPSLGIPAPKDANGKTLKAFHYQRPGDARYSMINNIVGDFQTGWLGYGPAFADPVTGQTRSACANINISDLDREAAYYAQEIGLMNGEVSSADFAFGFDIDRYMKQKLLETNGLTSLKPSNRAKEQMGVFFDSLKARGNGDVMKNAVGEVPQGRERAQMDKLKGTTIEQNLITPDDLIAMAHFDPTSASGANLDDTLLDAVSPLRGGDLLNKFINDQKRIEKMGKLAMDPIDYIDNLMLGQAIKYKDLPYAERLKALRADIYIEVTLHEVGHTVGLMHNMRGSSDALNYGKKFWTIQTLPTDMDDALSQVAGQSDAQSQAFATQLQACIDSVALIASDNTAHLPPEALTMTTQDCLEQQNSMCSSIMEYQESSVTGGDFGGLGPYDLAAIKFGYGQLLEVFDDGVLNTVPDSDPASKQSVSRRIFLNGFENVIKDVPRADGSVAPKIVNNVDDIYKRHYVKMEWNSSSTRFAEPANTVPYKLGAGAQFTPDDLTFDFGPDFRSNAKQELNNYFQGYFFRHFTRDHLSLYDTGGFFNAVNGDIRPMFDFVNKMQWFFFFEATDPDFKGSHAEEDLLGTTITGLNFIAKVIGHPANGRYVTVQKSDIFGLLDEPTANRTQTPSDIALPYSNLGECSARQVAVTGSTVATQQGFCVADADCSDAQKGNPNICGPNAHDCICDTAHQQCIDIDDPSDGVFVAPDAGYVAGVVPPSEGRPFFLGLTNDYEDWYVTYVGTFWSKIYALRLLTYDYAFFPRADYFADPRIYDISYYRLFPNEVSKLYGDMITDRTQDLGPLLQPDGTFVSRDLINEDLSHPDYTGMTKVLPSISFNHQYYALIWANVYNSTTDNTTDMNKSLKVALEGGNDDTGAFQAAIDDAIANGQTADSVVATFTHPVSGLTYRGLKAGASPVAYDLVNRLNLLADRFQHLDACVNDMHADLQPGDTLLDGKDINGVALPSATHLTDTYCSCIDNYIDYVSGDCLDQRNEFVDANFNPDTGAYESLCQPYVLENRRDSAREIMDDLVDFVGDVRSVNKYLGLY